MQPAELLHNLLARPPREVEGIHEYDLPAAVENLAGQDPLRRAESGDGHEVGRFDDAMRRGDGAGAGEIVLVGFRESEHSSFEEMFLRMRANNSTSSL